MGNDERAQPKVPLDQEWAALAKKMLRGADPEEKLTWRTPEVERISHSLVLNYMNYVAMIIKATSGAYKHNYIQSFKLFTPTHSCFN